MYRILIGLLLFSKVYAEEELSKALASSHYEPSYFGMIFGLFLVIGLIYLTGILYKKLSKIKLSDESDDKYNIQIITSTALGQNKNLFVVKINSKYCLLGATQNSITLIKDLGEDDEN